MKTLTRPKPTATPKQRMDYFASIGAALVDAGIEPGEEFVVARPDALAPAPATSPRRRASHEKWPSRGQRLEILEVILAHPDGITRSGIGEETGINLKDVGSRVWELKSGGWVWATTSGRLEGRVIPTEKALLHRLGE